jgi:2,3-bisphosphoglycerate-dependent phosphoglycerate mutase
MIDNPCTIYIARHGQTDWNIGRLLQGHTDVPLNKTGEEQARKLAKRLSKVNFDAVFSSDLIRAKRTAEILMLERGMAVKAQEVLREQSFGDYEGQHELEFFEIYDKWVALSEEQRKKHEFYEKLSKIESNEKILSRLLTFLRETSLVYRGKTILVVTHGGLIFHLLVHLGYAKREEFKFIDNGALVVVECDGVEFELKETEGVVLKN